MPGRVLVQRGHMEPPESAAPGIFALADPRRFEQLVTGAGFERPRFEVARMSWRFDDFDAYWSFTIHLAGAIALVIDRLDEREQAAVRDQVESDCAGFAAESGEYEFPAVALNVLAR